MSDENYKELYSYKFCDALCDGVVRSFDHAVWNSSSVHLKRTTTIDFDESEFRFGFDTNDDTAVKFLAHAATLFSEQVPADAVSLDLPTEKLSTSRHRLGTDAASDLSPTDRLGMSEELHSRVCELVLEAVEKHGGEIGVSTGVKTLIAAKQALPLVCAAVHWALTPHEQPIEVQSIGLDKQLSTHDVGFKIEFDIDNPKHTIQVLKDEQACGMIVEKTVERFVEKLLKLRNKHGFLQAIVCGPMQLEEGTRDRLAPLRKLKDLFESTVARLHAEGTVDSIRPDGLLRVRFVHSSTSFEGDVQQIRDHYIDGHIDIIINFNMLNVGFGMHTVYPSIFLSIHLSVLLHACFVVCRLPNRTRSAKLAHVRWS